MAVRPVAVGSFVLGGLALAVIGVLVFGGTRLFTRTIPVAVVFEGSVAGLAVGSPVTFRGVQIGAVTQISVHVRALNEAPVIPVILDLEPSRISWPSGRSMRNYYGLKHAIELGLRAQLSSVSLVTGQLDVELDFFSWFAGPVFGCRGRHAGNTDSAIGHAAPEGSIAAHEPARIGE
jgi:paraquat-inducible protein B